MRDYTLNKAPKDSKLCTIIRKTITTQKKEIGLSREDVANEIGLSLGTLDNKLTPAMTTNDLGITEFLHFLELTGDLSALEYIAEKFDHKLVKNDLDIKVEFNINHLVDIANIEGADVFREVKKDLEDGKVTSTEQLKMLKEVQEAIKALLNLEHSIKNTKLEE